MELVRLRLNDLDAVVDSAMSWINDPEVTKNLARFDHRFTREEETAFYRKVLASDTDALFAIEPAIGQIGIHQIYWPARNGRIATIIKAEHQGKGYATEANIRILPIAFDELGLNKLWAKVFADNPVTNRIFRNAGYRLVGMLEQEYATKDGLHDMNLYELTRDAWEFLKSDGFYR